MLSGESEELTERKVGRNTDQGNKWPSWMTCRVFYERHKRQLESNRIQTKGRFG